MDYIYTQGNPRSEGALNKRLDNSNDLSGSRFGSSLRLSRPRSSGSRYFNLADSQEHDVSKLEMLMASYLSDDPKDIAQFIANHIEYTLARSSANIDTFGAYQAAAYSVRDRLIEFWNDTQKYFVLSKHKMLFYMSIEYLLGRSLQNSVMNLNLKEPYSTAINEIGFVLESLYSQEVDAALGNGGLGRLAACFLDSLATMDFPAWGYGLRYRYGMFQQGIHNGSQVESPDFWLLRGYPWEICRQDITYTVRMYGNVRIVAETNRLKFKWENGTEVIAVAHDIPIPGYSTLNTINLRLWNSRPPAEFKFEAFSRGNYYDAVRERQESENIVSVLYPDDSTLEGRTLRLKQQYFFASASLQDIIRVFKIFFPDEPLSKFGNFIAIQLNDTHPAISVAELMRLLVDVEELGWEEAWVIVTETFGYTNHTVLPEALEEWSVEILGNLLPRHLQIIEEINSRFLILVDQHWPGDNDKKRELSIFREGFPKKIRMAHLSIVGSHSINGVAEIHTEILKKTVFPSFYELWPQKFNNKTNGVTPRRWIHQANGPLAHLLTKQLGCDEWVTNLAIVSRLRDYSEDHKFQSEVLKCKVHAKERLRREILNITNGAIDVNAEALFDIQVKRIHEYKRQLLNILGVMHRYFTIKNMSPEQRLSAVPRVSIFGGKAAPAYISAKNIIKLICTVSEVINRDPEVGDLLKVVFMPNYNVSLAEVIIPASDISEHISTAGMEASGTSNMKFAMNGGLILGTLDGANVEMAEEIGAENMFIFGVEAHKVAEARSEGCVLDERLYKVLHSVYSFYWADKETSQSCFFPILHDIQHGKDYYLVAKDFTSYLEAQERVDETWKDKSLWSKMCINTIAGMGKFSSDRTIKEYAEDIWNLKPCRVPETLDKVYHQ